MFHIADQGVIWAMQRLLAGDEYVIASLQTKLRQQAARGSAHSAFGAVANHRSAQLARGGESCANEMGIVDIAIIRLCAQAALDDKGGFYKFMTGLRGGQKIGPARHRKQRGAQHAQTPYAERRARPLERREAITLRPPTVAMRERKP